MAPRKALVRFIDQTTARRLSRRQAIGALGVLGRASCGGGGSESSSTSGSSTGTSGSTGTTAGSGTTPTTASCVLIPEETVGPYPLWNDIASAAVFQRQDITEGRPGVPLNLSLTVVNVNNNCAPVTNAMVYVWHCDKEGEYSGYGSMVGQTFCRGVQSTDSDGRVSFVTLYPGWYRGRITHIHFRIYLGNSLAATSQLAFPQDITTAVYNSPLYSARGQNTSVGSVASDGIFSDGAQYQMLSIASNAATGGYDGALTAGVAG